MTKILANVVIFVYDNFFGGFELMSKIVIFTGAGLSADSGISTFRDNGGIWTQHNLDTVCNYMTWKNNFDQVHSFYNMRRIDLDKVEPNPAHFLLAEWQKQYETILITQNIDDLLERAGCIDVIHVHGFLPNMRCTACGNIWHIGHVEWNINDRCPKCNSKKGVKPDVVFFHEQAPLYKKMWDAFRFLNDDDLLVVIGTSGNVIDIGGIARDVSCVSILNNLDDNKNVIQSPRTPMDETSFTHVIFKPACEAVDDLKKLVSTIM